MSLAMRVAELRRQKNQSLQQVADAVGVSKAHIWQIERNKAGNPSMAVLKGLAEHFGVTIASLVGEDPESGRADSQIARMFRQVSELEPDDRAFLEDMIQSMLRRRRKADARPV